MSSDDTKVYDVIGVGFGPANLALAVVLEEAEADDQLDRLFLEAKPNYVWHPGMLIEDSLLQITAIKDLITVVNPRSRFTFLNYLKEKGRLYEFLNLRDLFPTRLEFNDYLTWVAGQLDQHARYSRRVTGLVPLDDAGQPVPAGAPAACVRVEVRNEATGETEQYRTRNVVLATGGFPTLPEGLTLPSGGRAFHPASFLQSMEQFDDREAPYRFVVVGSGQSAGEIFEYLLDHYPNADVTATIRRFAYKPVDESDFTNRVFFPEWVDFYHDLPADKRRPFFAELKDVNYAVIDHDLIRRIYKRLYRQKVLGRERGRVLPFLQLTGIEGDGDRVQTTFRDLMKDTEVALESDGAVLCTGFAWPKEHPLLDDLAVYFERDDLGGYRVERDYGIASQDGFAPRVFLQGYCEDTHGISETVLSLLPVRAKDIEKTLLATRPAVASMAP